MRIRYFAQDPVVASSEQLSDGYVTEVTSVSSCVLDGRACVVTMNLAGRIRVLDPVSGVDVREPLGSTAHESTYWAQDWSSFLECVVIDGDPHVVVSAFFGDVECWNLRTGQQRCDAPDRVRKEPGVWLQSLLVRPATEGRWQVAFATDDGWVHVIDPLTGRAVKPSAESPVTGLEEIALVPGEKELLAAVTWRGEVVAWEAETMSLVETEVVPLGFDVEQVLGFVGDGGAPCLAAACSGGRLERRSLLTGEALEAWEASGFFVLAEADGFGSVAVVMDDGRFQARRLSDGEVLLSVDPPAADLWRVLPCTNAEGARRWVCLFDRELHVLDLTSGRWFDPVSISYPVQGKEEDEVHDMGAVPGGGVALGLVNGWAMVDLD
ncbi:hypothetical protein [Arachnia propionica]|uniref:Uncharacterized protein n=1 Tax=Arachnia propionica TaxID=1750 RepID=A0A3P1WYY4_9ACTN|nr:hypothetical protein [Arachnia propionica]RRD51395.1 hypothetical protein EII35_00485 [Arachnia propionica]